MATNGLANIRISDCELIYWVWTYATKCQGWEGNSSIHITIDPPTYHKYNKEVKFFKITQCVPFYILGVRFRW